MHELYLSLGSNMGDRQALLESAVSLLNERVGEVVLASALIETEPWGFKSENLFLNQAVKVLTELSPADALAVTQEIERELGRTRKSTDGHYHDRPVDIDLLVYDDAVISEPGLKIPHPLMHKRRFVLEPLCEIAPELVHPRIGLTVSELLSELDS